MQFCGECLDLPIRPKWSFQEIQKVSYLSISGESTRCCALPVRHVHLLQVSQEYAHRLVSAHTDSCPWQDTVCDSKLEKFPKLPARDVYLEFEQRYARLDKLSQLPPLTQQAVDNIAETFRCLQSNRRCFCIQHTTLHLAFIADVPMSSRFVTGMT